jgi:hypothetical protein
MLVLHKHQVMSLPCRCGTFCRLDSSWDREMTVSQWVWGDYVLRHLIAMRRTWDPVSGNPDQVEGILEFSVSLGMDDGYAYARLTMIDERWEQVDGRWVSKPRCLRVFVATAGAGLGEARPALPRYMESGPAVSSGRAAGNRKMATYLLERVDGDPGSLREEDNGSVSFTITRVGGGAAGS